MKKSQEGDAGFLKKEKRTRGEGVSSGRRKTGPLVKSKEPTSMSRSRPGKEGDADTRGGKNNNKTEEREMLT